MARTLAELQSDIEAREAAATPGTSSEAIYGVLLDLVGILQGDKDSSGTTDSKVQALNATILNLHGTINNQTKILQATKDALAISDSKTMAQMPEEAAKIYSDAQKWRNSL